MSKDAQSGGPDYVSEIIERLAGRGVSYERYELGGEVARGGQGEIVRVWDEDLRRTLAMKVIRRQDAARTRETPSVASRTLGRFLEEAQVTAQLDHPGIVPVHELGLDDSRRVYFTMKLVKGQTLKTIFEHVHASAEGWSLTRAINVLLKVCEAMAYAHAKGVVHRDLKPSNVMVGKYGEVYVMDWGLARVLDRADGKDIRIRREEGSLDVRTDRKGASGSTDGSPLVTMDGDVIGTPAYMSPEQANGDLEAMGPHSDVYAVGAMLYHLLTGHVPYVAPGSRPGNFAILTRVQTGPPIPASELAPDAPPELVAICAKAMAREPAERFADMQRMAAEIEAYLEHRPVPAHDPGLLHVARLALRRHRPVALTVAFAAALVVVLVAAFIARLSAANRTSLQRADVLEAAALVAEERELYPAVPTEVARMERWLARVDDVHSREARYAEGGDTSLLADLESLHGLRKRVGERVALAVELEDLRADDEVWNEVVADIAGSAAYDGLALEPQLGLVPLGKNASTGLWEFWHYASGEEPEVLDAETGLLDVRPGTAIVLVLIPAPEPFFLGKFEVTQAQFERVMGFNPSKYDEERARMASLEASPTHPVESVSWYDAYECCRRLALDLPTDDQWEVGCRAGAAGPLTWGADWTALEGVENVRDQSLGAPYAGRAPWNDGFAIHAPVGTYEANAFGLYDVHGNVAEWCRDIQAESPIRDVDPWSADEVQRRLLRMAFRGGSWYLELQFHDAGLSQDDAALALNHARGFRVARAVD